MSFHVRHGVTPTRDKADITTERTKTDTNWLPPANLTLLHAANKLAIASAEGRKIFPVPNLIHLASG